MHPSGSSMLTYNNAKMKKQQLQTKTFYTTE